MNDFSYFKANDIRGKLGLELNEDIAYKIGRAYATYLRPQKVALGHDIRKSSYSLKEALAKGLIDSGVDVFDIGLSGTEEVYFATFFAKLDGGIEITASHNPIDYNGMKLIREEARPISSETGLLEIKETLEKETFYEPKAKGKHHKVSFVPDYIEHLFSYISLNKISPLRIVVNAGNGVAGPILDAIQNKFRTHGAPIELIKIQNEPNSDFPNGIPNPLLVENRQVTTDAVLKYKADLGVAWDGDFDRCFFFDEKGTFIEAYYIVGLLAESFLNKESNATIIHDPRVTWNTIDIVNANHGQAIESKTGHAFIKDAMRSKNAIYGGEMSAHHYFRDFSYCDSGMIPFLLILELLSQRNRPMSEILENRINKFPSSGEINFSVSDTNKVFDEILNRYQSKALKVDTIDGLSFDMNTWRFNIRRSNTESLVRLNVESKENKALLRQKTDELCQIIKVISPS